MAKHVTKYIALISINFHGLFIASTLNVSSVRQSGQEPDLADTFVPELAPCLGVLADQVAEHVTRYTASIL